MRKRTDETKRRRTDGGEEGRWSKRGSKKRWRAEREEMSSFSLY